MSSGTKKVVSQDVKYQPQGWTNPFATAAYNGSGWNVTPSAATGKQLDLSQSQLYDVVKQLPTAGPLGMGNSFANSMTDPNSFLGQYGNAYKQMMDYNYGTPQAQKNSQQYGGDSTIGRNAQNNYNMQVGNNMWNNAMNAATTNYNGMLSGMTGLGASINDIYNQTYGTGNQALAGTSQYMSNAQQNAQRAYDASVQNANIANANTAAGWNAFGDLATLGLMQVKPYKATSTPPSGGGGYSDLTNLQGYGDSLLGGASTGNQTLDSTNYANSMGMGGSGMADFLGQGGGQAMSYLNNGGITPQIQSGYASGASPEASSGGSKNSSGVDWGNVAQLAATYGPQILSMLAMA